MSCQHNKQPGFLPLLSIMMILFLNSSSAENKNPSDTSAITIYSSAQPGAVDIRHYRNNPAGASSIPGYAMVRQERIVPLKKGRHTLKFTDVAAGIDPTTVNFATPDHPGIARVLEQNYQFDIVSIDKLMHRYLGQTVRVTQTSGSDTTEIEGVLLGTNGGLIIQKNTGEVVTLKRWDHVRFPSLPGGLLTRPTLVWLLDSDTSGAERIRLTYQTSGMTWWADYNLLLSENPGKDPACHIDLSAWVSLVNQSGSSFQDARLKLIAGDVNRATPHPRSRILMKAVEAAPVAEDSGFREKSLFEYHLYTLPRRVDLPNNSSKQIELFPAVNHIPCKKELVFNNNRGFSGYYGGTPNTASGYNRQHKGAAEAFLSFKNTPDNGMGIPLPAGRVRVSQMDSADGSLEFIGEDVIAHTPRNETVRIKLGNAFDVVGERTQTDIQIDTKARRLQESFEVTLRNQKDVPVTVKVIEPLYRWHQWKILKTSDKYHKQDASHVVFEVRIPPQKEKKLSYTVLYQW